MNDSYEVFPKVVSVGQKAKITIHGLRARTVNPGWIHNIEICSMTNHSDSTKIRALALPPRGIPVFSEPARGGVIEFHHTFVTKGEYRIIVRWDDETTKYVTTESVYAVEPALAQLRPYRGDLHIHTYYSDGRVSPIQMAVEGRKRGLDFAAITDHGRYGPSMQAIEMAEKIDLDLLLFPGEEISFPSGHIVSICASASVTDLIKNEAAYKEEMREMVEVRLQDTVMVENLDKNQYAAAKWVVDKIHEFGGFAFLAHPYWISGDKYHLNLPIFQQLLEDGDMDAVEVIGGFPPWDLESNTLAIARYYAEVAKGRKIPALGNSDTHFRTTVDIYGWYWTTVFAKSLCQADIFDAISNLKSVACERPNDERLVVCGPYDLVEYTFFLDREFFPLHDRICAMQAELYMDRLMGKEVSLDQLDIMKENLETLYSLCWQ